MTRTDPCVVFALRRESTYFRRLYPPRQRFPGAPCRAHFCGMDQQSLLMLETGVGAEAMAAALRWCLSAPRCGTQSYRPRFMLSVGFSGALQSEMRVGDLVLATEIVDSEGNCWPALQPSGLAAEKLVRGRLLCAGKLVSDPSEKVRLGQRHQALAVDMESAVAARFCHERSVPFACLRVISDEAATPLSSHLVECLHGGRVAPLRLVRTVIRHPAVFAELLRLSNATRRAARRLTIAGSLLG